ncbi:MAG: phosphoribosylanthranilate isomerase [Campylobacterota bacterium]
MKVKICGLTNLEDALFAADAGADALGFVFYEKSPRYVHPETVAKITAHLPPFVTTAGLFVNESARHIDAVCASCGLDRAQVHFDVDAAFFSALQTPALPVIRAKAKEDLQRFENRYAIIDSFSKVYGGSGKRLNLEWFEGRDNSKTILAGGLTPDNISQVQELGFYGVDVSSGVEHSRGKKDFAKIQKFITDAKKC